jgi:hypothetical protein
MSEPAGPQTTAQTVLNSAERVARVSRHFTLAEYNVSSAHPHLATGVPTAIRPTVERHAQTIMQPWRDAIGPLRIISGYRSRALNDAVGGSPTSQHVPGEAADVVPVVVSQLAAWVRLWQLAVAGRIVCGQAIYYVDRGFIHVALPSKRFPAPGFCVRWRSAFPGYPVVRTWADFQRLVPAAWGMLDIFALPAWRADDGPAPGLGTDPGADSGEGAE